MKFFFRIALGGATGHKTFARDLGVLVKAAELNKVTSRSSAFILPNGNRGDRKKARLKHLLETWPLEKISWRSGKNSRLQIATHAGGFEGGIRRCKITTLAHRNFSAKAKGFELRWRRHARRPDHAEADAARRGDCRPLWFRAKSG